ncbi:hypothetical protein KQX54_020633 [Cotesia glomerata]|uniref:Uncharacterized protein n=1 Tax=Cotesia glomerata TaxID=32391 RepID=A0AAV7HM51_COTGL|nr:hypothetical protein KQX54_020633 [Cotesia glomerata]
MGIEISLVVVFLFEDENLRSAERGVSMLIDPRGNILFRKKFKLMTAMIPLPRNNKGRGFAEILLLRQFTLCNSSLSIVIVIGTEKFTAIASTHPLALISQLAQPFSRLSSEIASDVFSRFTKLPLNSETTFIPFCTFSNAPRDLTKFHSIFIRFHRLNSMFCIDILPC